MRDRLLFYSIVLGTVDTNSRKRCVLLNRPNGGHNNKLRGNSGLNGSNNGRVGTSKVGTSNSRVGTSSKAGASKADVVLRSSVALMMRV